MFDLIILVFQTGTHLCNLTLLKEEFDILGNKVVSFAAELAEKTATTLKSVH